MGYRMFYYIHPRLVRQAVHYRDSTQTGGGAPPAAPVGRLPLTTTQTLPTGQDAPAAPTEALETMPHVRRILYALESTGHDVREQGRGWTVQHCPACGRTARGGRGLRITTRASDSAARLICNGAGCDQLAILAAIKLPSAALYADASQSARDVSPEHARRAAAWLAQMEASDLAARAKGARGILGHGRQRPIRSDMLAAVARLWAEAGCPDELEASQAMVALRVAKWRRSINRQWSELLAFVNGRDSQGRAKGAGGWAWSGRAKDSARPRVTVWRMHLDAYRPHVYRPDLAAREATQADRMAAIAPPAGALRLDSDLGAVLDPLRVSLINALAVTAPLTIRQLADATGHDPRAVERAMRPPSGVGGTFPPSAPHVLPPAHAPHGEVCGRVGGKVRPSAAAVMGAMLTREKLPSSGGRPAWSYSLGVLGCDWQAWAGALQLEGLAADRAAAIVAELDGTYRRALEASSAARESRMLAKPATVPGARVGRQPADKVRRRNDAPADLPPAHCNVTGESPCPAPASIAASVADTGAGLAARLEASEPPAPARALRWLDDAPPLPGLGQPLLIIGVDDPRPSWQQFEDECAIERDRQDVGRTPLPFVSSEPRASSMAAD